MINLNYNEFLLLWGLCGIVFLSGFGLGLVYAYCSIFKKLKDNLQ